MTNMDNSRSSLIRILGIDLYCRFQFSETKKLFGSYYKEDTKRVANVQVRQPLWEEWLKTGKPIDEHAEFSLLSGAVADALLPFGYCIMHAAAIRFRDHAYLFAAKPGVGKSTQVRALREEYPKEFSVICGDRPILQKKDDGTILVHPSPWNGKENWQGAESTPLEGIFLLERGVKTNISLLPKKQAIIPIFNSFISDFETEDTIIKLAAMESAILDFSQVYYYVSSNVPESTHILYDTIFRKQQDG